MPPPESDLRTRMGEDLRAAMRARDRIRVDVLRTTLAAIANAEAVPSTARPNVDGRDEATEVDRRDLDAAEVAAVVGREADELRAELALRRARGVPVGDLHARVDVLDGYLGIEGASGTSAS